MTIPVTATKGGTYLVGEFPGELRTLKEGEVLQIEEKHLFIRMFPVFSQQAGGALPGGYIPWWLAECAYKTYSWHYGESQSLEKIAARGGFEVGELGSFLSQPTGHEGVAEYVTSLEECSECGSSRPSICAWCS